MIDTPRYAKTQKGAAEIRERGRSLRGRMRTMLILVDPSKTSDELRKSAEQIGIEADFLETLLREGYVVALADAEGGDDPASRTVSEDELARFRRAKAFINDSVVDALGIRAFLFTLRLERCATLDDLARLLPDYEKQIAKASDPAATGLLVERATELVRRIGQA